MPTPNYQNYNGLPIAPTAPNLPVSAPDNYTPQFQNQILNVLRLYFNQLNNYTQATATPDYGTTINRPKTGLQTGQQYFDTTLDIPIWWNGTKWVNASGTGV
jgi:hypothetical protein